ncbi:hypothetical protein J8L98_08120 [Pseudoalteromonas sp. MMG013]|uniref:hypothetical protein n=1 Tax=Pseudoalteromonas sp. MMG013 TaxID=2822687 RepID=UPI001B391E6D|nr:hypothetical protein [Pseudoalteromonas sp. MMG013]MBQ4861655.1 hypothetical protein [Pseudoalteromonas sp. MMG013]
MQLTIKTVLYSAVLHIAVLYLFNSQNHITIPHSITPVLKTYLVIETNNRLYQEEKIKNIDTYQNLNIEASAPFKKSLTPDPNKTRPIPTSLKPVSDSQPHTPKTTKIPTTKFDINPRKFLQHVKAQGLAHTTPLSSSPHNRKNKRIITHTLNTLNKQPKVIAKNHTFTEYQHNNTCYKVFNGDVNNRVADSGLTTQWQSLPYTCNNTKITQAYDKVMNKWLKKKP